MVFCNQSTVLLLTACGVLLTANAHVYGQSADLGRADEYLIALTELEENVTKQFVCAIEGEAIAGYEGRPFPVKREEIFLCGANREKKTRLFASGMKVGSIDERQDRWQWELTLVDGGENQRRQFVEQDGQRIYKTDFLPRRTVPEFGPFGIVVANRMAWMANLVKPDWLKQLVAGRAELVDAQRKDNGNLVGSWAVNSPGCILKMEFDQEFNNLPVRISWMELIGSKSPDLTMKKGRTYSVSDVKWKKVGDLWLPNSVLKIANGSGGRPMSEEWKLHFNWRIGKDGLDVMPKRSDEDWLSKFVDQKLVDESWKLVNWKPVDKPKDK